MGNSQYGEYQVAVKKYGRNTQTAATKIVQLIEGFKNAWTRIDALRYRVGADDHILTLLRPLNMTTFSAAAAASQAVVNLTADPGVYATGLSTANNGIAANDRVVYQCADGTFRADIVSSVSSLAITLTSNLPTGGVLAGGQFWFFGIETDTNPNDAQAHPRFNALATTTLTLVPDLGSIPDAVGMNLGNGMGQPLLVIADNVTAAGFLEETSISYVRKAATI